MLIVYSRITRVADLCRGSLDEVFNPGFSPDGKHVVYAAEKIEAYLKVKTWALVEDGQLDKEYYEIGGWAFSPDGRHLAYTAETHGLLHEMELSPTASWSMIMDGQPGAEYTVILSKNLHFNPDGVLEFLAVRRGPRAPEEKKSDFVGTIHGSLYRVKYIPTP
jgi:roadblock/LC7 domain-containing protein